MIRSREKRVGGFRRGTPRSAAHDRRDEPLRVLVAFLLARPHANGSSGKLRAAETAPHEVTVQ